MAQTPFLGLTLNEQDGWPYGGQEISFLHGVVEIQTIGALVAMGGGVTSEGGFAVTAGAGLSVNIAAGSAVIVVTGGACFVARAASFNLTVPASSTRYIHAQMEVSTDNDSRKTGLPLLIVSASATEPNALLLAEVVTGASGVTSVIDRRRRIYNATYTAATPGNWAGTAPTTVAQAIDRLAAALRNSTGVLIP